MNKYMPRYGWFYLVVAVIGLVDSLYLLWIKLANDKAYCIQGIGDCWTVNTSKYSVIFGIPVSIFGILGYGLILCVILLETRAPFLQKNSLNILFGLTIFGMLYSIYLTYIEFFVIYAICPFCMISAIAMIVLFFLTLYRVVKNQTST